MKLAYEDRDQLSVIHLRGELAGDEPAKLREVLAQRLDSGLRDVVLDLREVMFIDSSGLELLLWLQEECAARLGQLRLSACQETVQKILEVTRLASRFSCDAAAEDSPQRHREVETRGRG